LIPETERTLSALSVVRSNVWFPATVEIPNSSTLSEKQPSRIAKASSWPSRTNTRMNTKAAVCQSQRNKAKKESTKEKKEEIKVCTWVAVQPDLLLHFSTAHKNKKQNKFLSLFFFFFLQHFLAHHYHLFLFSLSEKRPELWAFGRLFHMLRDLKSQSLKKVK
jgi:hypothetical protein